MANASEEQLEALDAYGRDVGLAFQIVDDLLDLTSNENELGKRTGKDSNRGKLTFPAILGVEESFQRAQLLVDKACGALDCFGSRADRLEALARFVLTRKR